MSPSHFPPRLLALAQQLQKGHSHALLLHGASGLGQWPLAQALAQSWLCEGQRQDGLACGECDACHLMQIHHHPDCFYLLPEALLFQWGHPLDEKAQKELDDKKRKPSKNISVHDVRRTIGQLQQTSGRANGRVVLVYPAESMGVEAANAFLKTLEEPPERTKIILVSENVHRLLPTIRSRCVAQALPWLSQQEALHWLKEQAPQVADGALKQALEASGGRTFDALAMLDHPLIHQWTQLPQLLAAGQTEVFQNMLPAELLVILFKLSHDLLCLKVQAAPRFFPQASLVLPRSPFEKLAQWSTQLGEWAKHIQHPLKPELLVEDMLAQTAALWQTN